MGCGGSKLWQAEQESMARRHGGIHKKEPFPADNNEHIQDCPPTLQMIIPVFDNNNRHLTNNLSTQALDDDNNNNENVDVSVDDNNNNENVDVSVFHNGDQHKNVHDIEVSSKGSSTQEEGEIEFFDDLAPGSPSFRVYCVQSVSVNDELDDISEQLQSEEYLEDEKDLLHQQSSDSHEVKEIVEKEVVKKHKRGIRKMRLITVPKGAGKSIMQSLYHFPRHSNYHSHQLVHQVAA